MNNNDCASLATIQIGDDVKKITNGIFYGTGIESITIPDNVTSIGDSSFSSCKDLTSVTIGNNVTDIRGSAFRDCSNLTSVTIPESVVSIGQEAKQPTGQNMFGKIL